MADPVRLRPSRFAPVLLAAAAAVAAPSPAEPGDISGGKLPAAILAEIEAAEYAFSETGTGAYSAPNRAQDLRAVIDERGLSLTPRAAREPSWTFTLRTAAVSRGDGCEPFAAARVQRRGERVELEHGALVEWYANDARGIEQGWTLHARPDGADDASIVVDVAIGGAWSAQVAPDGTHATLFDPAGEPTLRYHDLAAWDASGRTLDVRVGSAPGGLSIVVDDRDAVYPVTIDPIIGRWACILDGAATLARFGAAVANAGDVDGDGLDDVIVGAPEASGGQSNEGRAYLFRGSRSSGVLYESSWQKENDQAGAQFGSAVAGAGDVDGDGFDDVVIGAPLYSGGEPGEGRAYLHRGSATGLLAAASWGFESDRVNGAFGCSVASAGDVNNDGYDDVIVGATGDGTFTDEGSARVFLGSAAGLSATAAWTYTGGQPGAELGCSVASAGDVNGDGYDDVLIGARRHDAGQVDEGGAFLFLGGPAGLDASPAWSGQSDQAGARFGESVAGAGDVNGDGFDDVIVGAYAYDEPGAVNAGRVYVYLGSATGLSTIAAWSQGGTQSVAFFGFTVASVGDVDGDGLADVAVSATHADVLDRVDTGVVSVFLGSATGIANVASTVIAGDLPLSLFGTSVAGGGDPNGDGLADFLVGAPQRDDARGRVQAWLGRRELLPSSPSALIEGDQANSGFTVTIESAGDVNGDGFDDVIVGAPEYDHGQTNEGRAYVHLGSASGLELQPVWTAEGDIVESLFGSSVACAGDVNGDGFDDVIVGVVGYDGGQVNEGRALLFLGSASGPSPSADWEREGDQFGAAFAYAVSSAGDVDNDGFDDVLVAAPGFDDDQQDEGRVFVYPGSASGLGTIPLRTIDGNEANRPIGYTAACVGDVNGDGFDDIATSSLLHGLAAAGQVWVHYGSASGPSVTASWMVSDAPSTHFGASVDGAGDVNGDGFDDLIVGAPRFAGGQPTEGRATLYLGSATGLGATPAWTVESDRAGAEFGSMVRGAGDVNADGYADVIVGARLYSNGQAQEGRAFLYAGSASGPSTTPAWTAEGDQVSARFGNAVTGAGDVNGDGFADVVVGALNFTTGPTSAGRMNLYLGGPTPTPADCNGNGHADEADILFGTSTDVDVNHVPDECEVVAPDPYCFGDGSAAGCPCGNFGANGNGCATSFNPAGANISATGRALVSNDTLVLHGSGMSQTIVTFTQGTTRVVQTFGDGFRCVSGSVIRLGAISATGGQADYPSGASLPVSVRGLVPASGGTRHYQVWFRNAAAFCTTSTFNLTNGLTVYWLP